MKEEKINCVRLNNIFALFLTYFYSLIYFLLVFLKSNTFIFNLFFIYFHPVSLFSFHSIGHHNHV